MDEPNLPDPSRPEPSQPRRASLMRPLIGIPTFSFPANDYSPTRFVLNQTYANSVAQAGGVPILLPITDNKRALAAMYRALDGLLLPGGADISGHWYGGQLGGEPELERDQMELTLARRAYKEDLPTLGICRGLQLMNVALGGTLYQDLDSQRSGQRHTGEARGGRTHGVELDPHSQLAKIVEAEALEVNSLHHQGIDRLAHGLLPSAYADDRLIEGIEAPDKSFWLAVQWHPEELHDEESLKLFHMFITASSARRS